ncbi:AraC family transcriptional regulator [Intestinibacillus massiliensis]|nr:AraC family transcriptional regulator [Intestinibacillus massiliensis]
MVCREPGVLPGSEYFIGHQDSRFDPALHPAVMLCGHYHCVAGYGIDRAYYAYGLVAYIREGVMHLTYGGKRYEAPAGSILVLDCRQYHHFWAGEHMEFIWAHFLGDTAIAMVAEIIRLYGPVLRHTGGDIINRRLENLVATYRHEQPITMAWQALRLTELIYYAYPPEHAAAPTSRSDQAVAVAIEYMKMHIDRPISVDALADSVHMSRFHFSRVFRKETGMSPYGYLIHLRFNLAKYLLKTTGYTVREVAFAVGYQSEAGFANAFTEKVGLPPGAYRESPW